MAVNVYPWLESAWREVLARKAKLPHALLLRGREGIGKRDFARKLAQSLACETPASSGDNEGAACGVCQSCRWFAAEEIQHPDYREVVPEILRPPETWDAERKPSADIKIEDIRDLQDFISLSAHQGRGKTILLFPAEAMNVNAANALLKNLEEPPTDTRFILVTSHPHRLPATILSRCQQIALPAPMPALAEQWIMEQLNEQDIKEPALSLEQTGYAPLAALKLVEESDFWEQRKAALNGLTAREFDVFNLAERLRDIPVARLLGWLQRWSYDLLLEKNTAQVRYNPDYANDIRRVVAELEPLALARYHRLLVSWQRIVEHPLNPRLFIEQMLLSYAALLRGERDFKHAG